MPVHVFLSLLTTVLLAAAAPAQADRGGLIERINQYRESPGRCEGEQPEPVEALSVDDRLVRAQVEPGGRIQEALRAEGYRAGAAHVIAISGPTDAEAAMEMLRQRYCAVLLDARYSEIGVSHGNGRWHVVLAEPLLDSELGAWEEVGKSVLEQVNDARAAARRCGSESYDAAAPVSWNQRLAEAAREHSLDMAERDYMGHRSPDGEGIADRVERAGYRYRRIGENVAAGAGSVEEVMSGWLESPEHCVNIMNPAFTEMGAAYAVNSDSTAFIYWTQVFGTPP